MAGRRLVFLTAGDPLDVGALSGTPHHMAEALRAEYPELEVVRDWRPRWLTLLAKAVRRVSGGRVDPLYLPAINRWLAGRLLRRWRGSEMLVISALNSTLTGWLAKQVPTINISDATFRAMRSFYAGFGRLGGSAARWGDKAEADSILHSVHNSYSSGWAARSAIGDYGADPARVSVISWGCNIRFVEREPDRARGEICRLLFVGVDWARKGGDIVLETARILAERGFACRLELVGVPPPPGTVLPEAATVHGFLRKAVPGEYERLLSLFREASFLFLPTRQDCTPMVFAEANAYGTPALTRDVGGVAGVVEDGANGLVLPPGATPADFADAIEAAWASRDRYDALRRSSRNAYEGRLNWRAWAAAMRKVIEGLPHGTA